MEITDILMAVMVLGYSITIFTQEERNPSRADEDSKFTQWDYYWKSETGGVSEPSSWFTKNGKLFLSAFLVIIFGLNIFIFKSDWISTILFSAFIIFNYADYFRMEGYSSQCIADGAAAGPAKTCSLIIPSNKYYAEKYYELRIGYGTLILGTALVLAYRDIKSSCDNNINKIVLMISPLLMMSGLLLISYMVGEHDDGSITNTSFDYIHSYFKGVALPTGGTIGGTNHDDYNSYITSSYGYNDRSPGGPAKEIKAAGQGEADKAKKSRIENKIYYKMFLLVAFFGYLWYWALNNDGSCDFDLASPGKLFSKSPTYMIIFIVLSPFIIKNIMMNECLITTAEATYDYYEKNESHGSSPPGMKDTNFSATAAPSADYDKAGTLSCMFDKIGGLGIYLLMCMLCILIYSSSRVGQTLNVPMVTILLSGILGYMISPSGNVDCGTGAVQSNPNTGGGNTTTCEAWAAQAGNSCPAIPGCGGNQTVEGGDCTGTQADNSTPCSSPTPDAASCTDQGGTCQFSQVQGPACSPSDMVNGACPAGCDLTTRPGSMNVAGGTVCVTEQCESTCCED